MRTMRRGRGATLPLLQQLSPNFNWCGWWVGSDWGGISNAAHIRSENMFPAKAQRGQWFVCMCVCVWVGWGGAFRWMLDKGGREVMELTKRHSMNTWCKMKFRTMQLLSKHSWAQLIIPVFKHPFLDHKVDASKLQGSCGEKGDFSTTEEKKK